MVEKTELIINSHAPRQGFGMLHFEHYNTSAQSMQYIFHNVYCENLMMCIMSNKMFAGRAIKRLKNGSQRGKVTIKIAI